jgi:hypothetical protein
LTAAELMDADFSDSGINGPDGTPVTDSIVLEEEIDPNYVPSDEEGMSGRRSCKNHVISQNSNVERIDESYSCRYIAQW